MVLFLIFCVALNRVPNTVTILKGESVEKLFSL